MALKVHCPECRGQFRVDGEESRSRFDCPFCSAPFRFQDKQTVVLSTSPLTAVEVEKLDTPAPAMPEANEPGEAPSAAPPPPGSSDAEAARRAAEARHREAVTRPAESAPANSARRSRFGAPEPPSPEELTPLRPGDVLNGVRLEEVVGWGGMSVVFRAQQLSLGRNVAVKVMRKELGEDPEFSRRFLNEARALAELSHPNIVQVIDQGIHEGNHFLVMEYIDGVSLREVLAERRLTPGEALRLVPDLCAALEYAHSRGIIHRDIKPENILVTKAGVPKIADFGLVRMIGEEAEEYSRITQTRTVLGTVDYMAPEQREGQRDVDHRADIYSLGVVLYEMLTGELPLARFPLPSERAPVDSRLDEVVLKVLQKDRERRYQRASMIATDLEGLDRAPARRRCGWGSWRGPWFAGATRSRGRGRGGRTGDPLPSEGPVHEPPPGVRITGQIASLLWFPVVVLFFGLAGDEELAAFAGGAALPWFAMQCRIYGWLPPVHERLIRLRWLGWPAAIALWIMVEERALDDTAGLFALGVVLSSIFALRPQPWSRGATIESGPFATRPRSDGTGAQGFGPYASAPAPAAAPAAPAPGDTAPDGDPGGTAAPPPPPARRSASLELRAEVSRKKGKKGKKSEQKVGALAGASSGGDDAVAGIAGSDEDAESRPQRRRTSFPAVLSFVTGIAGLLYGLGIAIPLIVAGEEWHRWFLELPIEYRDLEGFVRDVAPYSPDPLRSVTGLRALLFVPLGIPVLFALGALPGLIEGRRRGASLAGLGLVLPLAGFAMIATTTGVVSASVDRYCHYYDAAPNDALELMASARDTEEPLERVAYLHRFAGHELEAWEEAKAGEVLIDLALDPNLSVQERKLSLILFDWSARGRVGDPDAFSAVPNWFEKFQRNASDGSRVRHDLRRGFRTVVDRLTPH